MHEYNVEIIVQVCLVNKCFIIIAFYLTITAKLPYKPVYRI